MKAHYLLPVFLLSCFSFASFSQIADLSWEQSLKLRGIDYYCDVVEDAGEGFTVLGARKIQGRSLDIWLVKYNTEGDTLWTRTMGTETADIPKRIALLSDKNYLIAASTQVNELECALLLKVDPDGNELWRKTLDSAEHLRAEDMVALEEGEFALAGSKGPNAGNPNIWMAKMDAAGEIIWEEIYQKEIKGCAKSIRKLPDGGFAIAGQVSEGGQNDCDIMALRTDEKGTAKWFSWFKSPNQKVWPECICCSPDSCFIVVGWRGKCLNDVNSENAVFDYDLVLNKIHCDGEIEWTKSFDREGSEGGSAVTVLPNGNFIVGGIKATSFLGKVGPWLLQVDAQGNEINEALLKFQFQNDRASRIINCSDGGFIVIGPGIQDETNTRSDGLIMKFTGL